MVTPPPPYSDLDAETDTFKILVVSNEDPKVEEYTKIIPIKNAVAKKAVTLIVSPLVINVGTHPKKWLFEGTGIQSFWALGGDDSLNFVLDKAYDNRKIILATGIVHFESEDKANVWMEGVQSAHNTTGANFIHQVDEAKHCLIKNQVYWQKGFGFQQKGHIGTNILSTKRP